MVAGVLTAVRAVALTALFALPVATAVSTPESSGSLVDRQQIELGRTLVSYHCSTEGLPDDVQPASVLIRTPSGRTRVVSVAAGRAVTSGREPGILVALCTDPVR